MSFDLAQLDALKAEWDTLQPLAAEREHRLWKKLRLEWNYHSNHIEGNTLTYGETELLLLHGQAVGDHPLRDYEEMKAHDAAIAYVRQLAADRDRLLTEADLRDLNRIILKEPFWKAAQTLDGRPTRKQILPGQYKTTPNNVRTATGDIFEFATVEETAPRMAALAVWLRESLAAGGLHPISVASKLHHDFVLIHPFDDGNGRVARLLVNYVLLRAGFPPIIVRSDDKTTYLTALRKADAGELDALTDYLATALRWSLSVSIRAAKGESIEEPSDTEKEVTLFVRDQQARKNGEPTPTDETLANLVSLSLQPLVKKIEEKLIGLAPLFERYQVRIFEGIGTLTEGLRLPDRPFKTGLGQKVQVFFNFESYRGAAPTAFDLIALIELHFGREKYSVTQNSVVVASHPYSKLILGEEADVLASQILASEFQTIKFHAGVKPEP